VKRSKPRRVVLTGVGPVAPLGVGRDAFWAGLLAGRCAADEVCAFDTSRYRVHRGCEVRDFDFEAVVGQPSWPCMGRAAQFAVAATSLALADGRLEPASVDPRRVGVSIGTTCGEIQILEARNVAVLAGAAAADDAAWLAHHPACVIPASVGHWFGFSGPNLIIPTACAAGNFSVSYAMDLVRNDRADVMVAGGTDPFSRVAFTGFARLGSVAPRLCQPFDQHRRGILVGEGAGIVLVEALDHALARRAPIYAELLGYGLTSDARHIAAPDPEGDGMARAMMLALRSAGLDGADVDYVCAHGTGTSLNDAVETKAIKQVLGEHAPTVPVSSIKSMLGHTMGAASALEGIACALALRDGVVPPTINYETPDPACDLDYVPNRSRPHSLRVALNNALAFGGVNSCLALGRWEDHA
jgi:3-oxoacyl-[acyl-carrier-protein] synthase II